MLRRALPACLMLLLAACATSPESQDIETSDIVVPAAGQEIPEESLPEISADEIQLAEDVDAVSGSSDLWDRIRGGFTLAGINDSRIDVQRDWYAKHQAYLDRVATRATPYMHLIVEEIQARGMPMEIALLPIVESAFDPFAYSHGRAAGLWQFIPGTGKRFELKQNWWYDGRRDVAESTRAALDYLEYLHLKFDDWLLALAAYNSGEGNVARAVRNNERKGLPTDFWHLNLPRETEAYVPKLLALKQLAETPAEYGIALQPIPDEAYLDHVDVGQQIDLAFAAELAELDVEQVFLLNPGYNRWATDPDGPHKLLLPIENAEILRRNLAELGPRPTVEWRRHLIRSGENLGGIAHRYHTTVDLLKEINGIRGNMIRAGQYLMVPVSRQKLSNYALSESNRLRQKQNTERNGTRLEHVVQSGESFWSISRRYDVNLRSLAAWNGKAPTDPLRIGDKLVVWSKQATPVQHVGLTTEQRVRTVTYTVRRGDSLAKIASRFGVRVSDITRWNNISSNEYLQPGQRLTLTIDVTRQST